MVGEKKAVLIVTPQALPHVHTRLVGSQRRSASAQATPVLTKAFSQSDCNLIIS